MLLGYIKQKDSNTYHKGSNPFSFTLKNKFMKIIKRRNSLGDRWCFMLVKEEAFVLNEEFEIKDKKSIDRFYRLVDNAKPSFIDDIKEGDSYNVAFTHDRISIYSTTELF